MHTTRTAILVVAVAMYTAALTARQVAPADTATVKQVMLTMTIPASDAIFSAAFDPPKDAKAWQALRTHAATLVESGTLLMTSSLAKDNTTWMEMARGLVTEAQATVKATDAKNVDALAKASDKVYTTCETCHDRYMDK